jgi:hypothetical protein
MAKKKRLNGKSREKRGIDLAIEAANRLEGRAGLDGGQAALARLMGVERGVIAYWYRTGMVAPLRAAECEEKTGVPRHKLNPKYYPEAA